MNLNNYINYGMCIYENKISHIDIYKLGDVVINEDNEIGVVIQIHSPFEFRTDMFGNTSVDEVKPATTEQIQQYRPLIKEQAKFKHN